MFINIEAGEKIDKDNIVTVKDGKAYNAINTLLERTEESKTDKIEVLDLFKLCDNCKQPLTQYVKITQHSEDGKESKEICPMCLKNPIKGSVFSSEAVNYRSIKKHLLSPKSHIHIKCAKAE